MVAQVPQERDVRMVWRAKRRGRNKTRTRRAATLWRPPGSDVLEERVGRNKDFSFGFGILRHGVGTHQAIVRTEVRDQRRRYDLHAEAEDAAHLSFHERSPRVR